MAAKLDLKRIPSAKAGSDMNVSVASCGSYKSSFKRESRLQMSSREKTFFDATISRDKISRQQKMSLSTLPSSYNDRKSYTSSASYASGDWSSNSGKRNTSAYLKRLDRGRTIFRVAPVERKDGQFFPPLARETTNVKDWGIWKGKKKFTTAIFNRENGDVYQGPADDVSDSHWSLERPRQVDPIVDRRIVTHLRRKLNRRLDRRYNVIAQEEFDEHLRQRTELDVDEDVNSSVKSEEPRDLFHKYTEYGERISENSIEENPDVSIHFSHEKHEEDSKEKEDEELNTSSNGPDDDENDNEAKHEQQEVTSLPNAEENVSCKNETQTNRDETVQVPKETKKDDEKQPENETQNKMDSNFVTSLGKTINGPEEISPVSTPRLYRPETRENGRLTLEQKKDRILMGKAHIKYPMNTNVIKTYISSANVDSIEERSALVEKVYPGIRELYMEKGYDLQVVDLNWGVKGLVFDDHSQTRLTMQILAHCQENHKSVNFITFLNQKYGQPIVPAQIPKEQFEKIIQGLAEEQAQQVKAAAERAEQVAAKGNRKGKKKMDIMEGDLEEESQETTSSEIESESQLTNSAKSRPTSKQVDFKISVDNSGDEVASTTSSARKGKLVDAFKKEATSIGKKMTVLKAMQRQSDVITTGDYPDVNLLKTWYKFDENAVPAVYRLQKISSQVPDFTKKDVGKRKLAHEHWDIIARKIQKLLYTYAQQELSPDVAEKYCKSLIAMEVETGILCSQDPLKKCVWFKRTLENLHTSFKDENAKNYMDVNPMKYTPDTELQDKLHDLTENKLEKVMDEMQNIKAHLMTWHHDGINPKKQRVHNAYVERVCKEVRQILTSQLDFIMEADADICGWREELFQEILQHINFCQTRSKQFYGRKHLLQTIKDHVRSSVSTPLIIHGQLGCGRKSLMAKAVKDTYKWLKGKDVATIVRMIGVTPESRNIRLLLKSLCTQLCEIFETNPEELPEDVKGLQNAFAYRLGLADESVPLIIYLDSLEMLTDDHDAKKLTWLPKELPSNVHLILSTSADETNGCMKALKKMFKPKECYLEIPALPVNSATTILDHWYQKAGRTVSSDQKEFVITCFKNCQLPLYLKLLFRESLFWPSYLPADSIKLGNTAKKVATVVFGRLELNHGEPLVRRVLGYITAARNGISSTEMEDLLSLDEVVIDDVCAFYKPNVRRIPQVSWLRLRDDLGDYLEETIADDFVLLRWFHQEFFDAAVDRYHNQRDKAPSYHKAIGEYFLDMWSNKPKPFGSNETGLHRYVTAQPLYREITTPSGSSQRIYNKRRLNELPFHLLKSQQMDVLKRECFYNFEFVLAKICGTTLKALTEELNMALEVEPGDLELKMLSDTIHLSTSALMRFPQQLGSQVVGRLQHIVGSDNPVAPGDPAKYPLLKIFYNQAWKGSLPALLPSRTCLTPPGDILFDLLSGHSEPITAVAVTTNGQRAVTTSRDHSMKVWDLRSGRVTLSIKDVGSKVSSITVAKANNIILTTEFLSIRVWNMLTGALLKTIDGYDDPPIVTSAGEGDYMVAFFDGSNDMRVWDLKLVGDINMIQEVSIDDPEEPIEGIHKDNSILVSNISHGPLVLFAYRSDSKAFVWDCVKGTRAMTLQCSPGSIVAVTASREYFIVALKVSYMKLHEMIQLELFDNRNGKYIRSVRGCMNDNVTNVKLCVNQMGSHVICACPSEVGNFSDIAVWNLETEDHKHIAKHASIASISACIDLRYCLTGARDENTLRIWNLSTKVNQQAPKEKPKEGTEAILPMQGNPRYVVVKQINEGPLMVWNVAKNGCTGEVVRSERGIINQNDVVLVNDDKAIILTNKGFSAVSTDRRPVFQSIRVYDLKEQKFIRQLSGCYIIPVPANEYVLLNSEMLLGLNNNRSHFVVWSLETGQVTTQMKPNFRVKRQETRLERTYPSMRRESTTAKMLPWDRRNETRTAKERRRNNELVREKTKMESLKKEKDNAVEQYIISKDYSTIVSSFYAHHLCVFDVKSRAHTHTLEDISSMLHLYVAALTDNGSHLVLPNYDDDAKTSFLTLWDLENGAVKRRLRNEKNVCAIAISDHGSRVVFGKANGEMRIWDPLRVNIVRRIKGYSGLDFRMGSSIHLIENATKAIVYAGDISIWDLDKGNVLTAFTPDASIHCFTLAMNDNLILFGLKDIPDLVTIQLASKEAIKAQGHNAYGEKESSDEESGGEAEEEELQSYKS